MLLNACKYTALGRQIGLAIKWEAVPENGAVSVLLQFSTRNQADILMIELPKPFEKFYRCRMQNRGNTEAQVWA